MSEPKEPEFYSSVEVAAIFSASPQTVRRWIQEGKIQGNRIGKKWLVPREEVGKLKQKIKGKTRPSPAAR